MNKYKTYLLLVIVFMTLISGCRKTLNMENVVNEANFEATIKEVYENSILVKVSIDEYLISADLIKVSLDVKVKESITNFEVGDKVRIYYDGSIAESYPAQVNNTYAIIILDRNK